MACHAMDKTTAGPSLIEVGLIHKNKPGKIVEWAKKPARKRKALNAMPPMAFVGDEKLKKIADYILKITKGKTKRDIKDSGSKVAVMPARIQRVFMPDSGPASIAVRLTDNYHYCWDAGKCKIRYTWKGGFIDPWPVWRGNGNGLAKLLGTKDHTFSLDNGLKSAGKPKFLGYKVINGLPQFIYRLGSVQIREHVTFKDNSLVLNFKIKTSEKITYQSAVNFTASKGTKSGNKVTLTPEEAADFSITFKGGVK